jgi:biotin-dependent carboxylase-like uncharacterized protein
MSRALRVVEPGLANAVHDRGRFGLRTMGVPVSGAADAVLMACSNLLLGNAEDAAVIEMPFLGPTVEAVAEPVAVALMGSVSAQCQRADGQSHAVLAGESLTLLRGDRLRVLAVREGVAYLAVSGGCRVPAVLGSRSTYARARLGGVQGRALQALDEIECGAPASDAALVRRAAAFRHPDGPIRLMRGPQDDAFEAAAFEALATQPYRVGRESDRMGMRLEGPRLAHRAGSGADITSEGVVPGAMQVPANGQPIILLADAQTVGGYTKIATVIRADLPRLAHLRAGQELRFAFVERADALQALAAQRAAIRAWAAGIRNQRAAGAIDLQSLVQGNLVSGIIDARRDALPWESPT